MTEYSLTAERLSRQAQPAGPDIIEPPVQRSYMQSAAVGVAGWAYEHFRAQRALPLADGTIHDFNNLLQGVVSALGILQRRIEQGRLSELASPIEAALASIDKAAVLSRHMTPSVQTSSSHAKATDVEAAIKSMEDVAKCTIGEQIELRLMLKDGNARVMCDPWRLENALLNLVINARDAMPGGGRITIATCHVDNRGELQSLRPGSYVGICVADTGAGMTEEVADRAFDAYFTTKAHGCGTGLGLAMIKHFVDELGGCINMTTALGRGTAITLYLPRCTEDA